MDHAPSRWRGALLVSVADARPLAVVHMPGGTIAPFLMAVGFVFVFEAALVEWRSLLVAGALICLTALAVWFWPKASERAALEDGGVGSPAGRLPLAVAGPLANGWWGTVSLIVWGGGDMRVQYDVVVEQPISSLEQQLHRGLRAFPAGHAGWSKAHPHSVRRQEYGLEHGEATDAH